MTKRAVWHGLLYLGLAGASLQADTIVLGIPAVSANCDPIGCPTFFGLGTYQQVYLGNAFPGAMTIDDIGFYQSEVLGNGGQLAGGTFTLSLSYTTASPLGGLDVNNGPSANIEPGTEEQFFTGTLPAFTPYATENILTFSGTPFAYNPADGNLLLTVSVTGGTDSTPYLFMDETGTTPVTSSAYFGTGNGANSTGLVTGINYTPATGTSTPEPASLVLVLAGIGLIGYKVRRHRTS
ncbi:MAG: PEP-CTERM sorting domain-containing protein [Bryobacteraceae bacterium]